MSMTEDDEQPGRKVSFAPDAEYKIIYKYNPDKSQVSSKTSNESVEFTENFVCKLTCASASQIVNENIDPDRNSGQTGIATTHEIDPGMPNREDIADLLLHDDIFLDAGADSNIRDQCQADARADCHGIYGLSRPVVDILTESKIEASDSKLIVDESALHLNDLINTMELRNLYTPKRTLVSLKSFMDAKRIYFQDGNVPLHRRSSNIAKNPIDVAKWVYYEVSMEPNIAFLNKMINILEAEFKAASKQIEANYGIQIDISTPIPNNLKTICRAIGESMWYDRLIKVKNEANFSLRNSRDAVIRRFEASRAFKLENQGLRTASREDINAIMEQIANLKQKCSKRNFSMGNHCLLTLESEKISVEREHKLHVGERLNMKARNQELRDEIEAARSKAIINYDVVMSNREHLSSSLMCLAIHFQGMSAGIFLFRYLRYNVALLPGAQISVDTSSSYPIQDWIKLQLGEVANLKDASRLIQKAYLLQKELEFLGMDVTIDNGTLSIRKGSVFCELQNLADIKVFEGHINTYFGKRSDLYLLHILK